MGTKDSGNGHETPPRELLPEPMRPGKCNGLLRDGSGRRCKLPAGHGTDHVGIGVCKRHGGNTETHKRHAIRVQGAMDVARLGGRRDVHPAEALLELVQFGAVTVEYWRNYVAALPEPELIWGVTKEEEGAEVGSFSSDPKDRGLIGVKTTREAKPHVALGELKDAERNLAAYCSAALKAGVDAAMVQIAESQAARLVLAMDRFANDPRVTVVGDVRAVVLDAIREVAAQ